VRPFPDCQTLSRIGNHRKANVQVGECWGRSSAPLRRTHNPLVAGSIPAGPTEVFWLLGGMRRGCPLPSETADFEGRPVCVPSQNRPTCRPDRRGARSLRTGSADRVSGVVRILTTEIRRRTPASVPFGPVLGAHAQGHSTPGRMLIDAILSEISTRPRPLARNSEPHWLVPGPPAGGSLRTKREELQAMLTTAEDAGRLKAHQLVRAVGHGPRHHHSRFGGRLLRSRCRFEFRQPQACRMVVELPSVSG
jgi:hypothetical protein